MHIHFDLDHTIVDESGDHLRSGIIDFSIGAGIKKLFARYGLDQLRTRSGSIEVT